MISKIPTTLLQLSYIFYVKRSPTSLKLRRVKGGEI